MSRSRQAGPRTEDLAEPVIRNGRVRQSIMPWCLAEHWDTDQTIRVAKRLGCPSVELVHQRYYPVLKEQGLDCAIARIDMDPDPPYLRGFNNPEHWPEVLRVTRDAIDACAHYGFERVIAFTGMRDGIPDDVGAANCVAGLKRIVGYAERHGVTLCLEMLNTRETTDPRKGHPGYQGDHTEYCVDIINRVGSPSLKLLFDIYHVQIMDGDIMRRIRQYKDLIGHVHTAGNPGRCELDDRQEIAYKPIMEALVGVGYRGYVAHEFFPTGDPWASLRHAVALCDV